MAAMNRFGSVVGLLIVLTLGACGTVGYPTTDNTSSGYGVVQSIELIKQGDSSLGVGTIAGGVVGGVLGSQVVSGTGQTAATIGGAAAGAYIGHQLEKGKGDVSKFTIRMDSGTYQTLTQSTSTNFRVGDRVRIENGVLSRP
jgi:outer membrane lipoprotein SlyB